MVQRCPQTPTFLPRKSRSILPSVARNSPIECRGYNSSGRPSSYHRARGSGPRPRVDCDQTRIKICRLEIQIMGMQCRMARSGSGGCGSVHDFQGIEDSLWQTAAGCVGALSSGSF